MFTHCFVKPTSVTSAVEIRGLQENVLHIEVGAKINAVEATEVMLKGGTELMSTI